MALSEAEWEAIHRALWAAVGEHTARLGETTAEYVQAILGAITAGGTRLSVEGQQYVTDYLDAAEGAIRTGIEAALAPVAGTLPAAMRDAFIREQTAAAYARRWPDGLTLSRRVWSWQRDTQAAVDRVLREALRLEQGSTAVLMDMQRAIEGAAGERFAMVSRPTQDWASELYDVARGSAQAPGAMNAWHEAVTRALDAVSRLQDGGTRRQAAHALEQMRAAVAAGRTDLLDKAVHWWLYDKQLYRLRRIARTEMATAHHQAVIAATQEDDLVLGYRWRLSAGHPIRDICDDYAAADFGLGAGVWPKDRVPRGKAHPQCMCLLVPTTRRMRRDGVRGVEPSAELLRHAGGARGPAAASGPAAAVASSPAEPGAAGASSVARPPARAAAGGGDRPAPMAMAEGGDGRAGAGDRRAAAPAILAGPEDPYVAAQTAGRPHHGWMQGQRRLPTVKLQKALRSLRKQIAQHEAWIADPWAKCAPGTPAADVEYYQNVKWPGDIARQREQIAIIEGVLRERDEQA